jgi:hypothetical protein
MAREIRLPAQHPRLRPRIEGQARRPGHPGTAVQIGDDLYEVVAAEGSAGEWIYRLAPWPEQETVRAVVVWSEGSEREFAAGLCAERARERKTFLSWAAQAFLGFLPAGEQERIFQARGLDPGRATLWSAALETALAAPPAILFLIRAFAGGAGGSGGFLPAWVGLPACAIAAEGVFRLVTALSTGEPIGSMFTAFLGFRLRSEAHGDVRADEILEIEGALKVLAPVPKVWWERAGGVTYGGEPYILAGWGREGTTHAYRFRKGGEGFPVLDPEREKARNRSSDLSYVFAFLWGFLPPGRQESLESYGRYRSRPYVLASIAFTFLAGLALCGPGLRDAAGGRFGSWNVIRLVLAIGLFAESVSRLVQVLKGGRVNGSVLGLLVGPLYDRAIKDPPVRPS